jgi:cephalosporin hydroxylase
LKLGDEKKTSIGIGDSNGKNSETIDDLALRWTRRMWGVELWKNVSWLGFPIQQWPTDMVVLQEIVFAERPKVIIETGSNCGGSAVYFASLLQLLGGGKVISIDIHPIPEEFRKRINDLPFADSIHFVEGDSAADNTLLRVRELVGDESDVFVLLDSDHGYEHVKREIAAYAGFVPDGGAFVVGDTICRELSVLPGLAAWAEDNPRRAVDEFLAGNEEFARESRYEKFKVTFFPGGFLRRVKRKS